MRSNDSWSLVLLSSLLKSVLKLSVYFLLSFSCLIVLDKLIQAAVKWKQQPTMNDEGNLLS